MGLHDNLFVEKIAVVAICGLKFAKLTQKRRSERKVNKILKDISNKEANKHNIIDSIKWEVTSLPYKDILSHKEPAVLIKTKL